MYGNVWEMCLDWYEEYDFVNVCDFVGFVQGDYWVLWGLSWKFFEVFVCFVNCFKNICDIVGFWLVMLKK